MTSSHQSPGPLNEMFAAVAGPAPLSPTPGESSEGDVITQDAHGQQRRDVIVLYSYDPPSDSPNDDPENELKLVAGEIITVLGRHVVHRCSRTLLCRTALPCSTLLRCSPHCTALYRTAPHCIALPHIAPYATDVFFPVRYNWWHSWCSLRREYRMLTRTLYCQPRTTTRPGEDQFCLAEKVVNGQVVYGLVPATFLRTATPEELENTADFGSTNRTATKPRQLGSIMFRMTVRYTQIVASQF